uniref:Uncharacterized protein n=1 Tax=Aplanochytrium stocchinoi TaxID=215587 RepID=A0A7S3V124_9STRA
MCSVGEAEAVVAKSGRVKGHIYLKSGLKCRWDGKRWRKLCQYSDCTARARNPIPTDLKGVSMKLTGKAKENKPRIAPTDSKHSILCLKHRKHNSSDFKSKKTGKSHLCSSTDQQLSHSRIDLKRKDRVKGEVYVNWGLKCRWDGKRWRKLCQVSGCTIRARLPKTDTMKLKAESSDPIFPLGILCNKHRGQFDANRQNESEHQGKLLQEAEMQQIQANFVQNQELGPTVGKRKRRHELKFQEPKRANIEDNKAANSHNPKPEHNNLLSLLAKQYPQVELDSVATGHRILYRTVELSGWEPILSEYQSALVTGVEKRDGKACSLTLELKDKVEAKQVFTENIADIKLIN